MARIDLRDEHDWKRCCVRDEAGGFYDLATRDTHGVPVRLFLDEGLLIEAEPGLYRQIVHATRFPGAKLVAITPDVHVGYGVPVGSVILTDRDGGALAMGPVGFDIGCGMISARSTVDAGRATHERKLRFHREVTDRVALGPGGRSVRFGELPIRELQEVARGGAEHYASKYGSPIDRSRSERQRFEVDDAWDMPLGGAGSPERGAAQLGTLGGGNHFIELQRCEETGTLFVQLHTGSRGFGHGLATSYFDRARSEAPDVEHDLGYFVPGSEHFEGYRNAVAAGANFAIVNRLVIFEAIAEAFEKVFGGSLELVYEISHNLVQPELHPDFGEVWAHRKGATRAFPAGHPDLAGTPWEAEGHPVLIPGSNRDFSFILRPLPGAAKSGYSVNHGAGRRMSRGEATRVLSQEKVDEQYARDGILVNLDGRVPLDEAGACYKSSERVIDAVVAAGLARVEHRLWPLGSLKGNEEQDRKKRRSEREGDRKARDLERRRARDKRS
jgi:tRNA-splicing ligase RtcB